jgi:hypothetical protein
MKITVTVEDEVLWRGHIWDLEQGSSANGIVWELQRWLV